MWTLFVVALSKLIERLLLSDQIRTGWARCLRFERSVHTLVPTVLIRTSRLDANGMDTELDPPDSEPRQTCQRIRADEWNSIVCKNLQRQAILAK